MVRTTKQPPLQKHTATMQLTQPLELAKTRDSLFVVIRLRGQKVGELSIGRGSVVWWGRKAKKRKRMGWSRFVDLMNRQ